MGYDDFHGESRARRERIIDCFLDAGLSSIDTAPLYGFGEAERLLGEALRGRRQRAQILTKCGMRWDGGEGAVSFEAEHEGKRVVVRRNSRPASLREELQQSLRRLGVESVDLLQIHQPDLEVALAESLRALREECRLGRVGALGACNGEPSWLGEALRAGELATVQLERNLLSGSGGSAVVELAQRCDAPVLAYSPLAQGLLAGRATQPAPADFRAHGALFQPEAKAAIAEFLAGFVQPVAAAYSLSVAQLALAWLLRQPGVHPIVGASRVEHVEQCLAAAAVTLNERDAQELQQRASALSASLRTQPWSQRLRRLPAGLRRRLGGLRRRLRRHPVEAPDRRG